MMVSDKMNKTKGKNTQMKKKRMTRKMRWEISEK